VRPDGKVFYVTWRKTAGDIFAIDAETGKNRRPESRCIRGPRSIDFLPDGPRVRSSRRSLSANLNVIDSVNQSLLKVITLAQRLAPAMCESFRPTAKKVFMSAPVVAATVVVVDANTYELLNTIQVGQRPWGIALSPDGKYLFAANGPSDDVSVVDPRDGQRNRPRQITRQPVGRHCLCRTRK